MRTPWQPHCGARRVGVDRAVGICAAVCLPGCNDGMEIEDIHLVSAEDLHDRVVGDTDFVLAMCGPLELEG